MKNSAATDKPSASGMMDLLAKEKETVASFLSVRELLSKIKLFYSPIKPPLTLKNTGVTP